MADVNANIGVSIDTSAALANLKNLQRQISAFHTSMAKSGAAASAVSAGYQQNLINSINQSGKFSASMKNIKSTTDSFTNSLEKNKLSMREYFRYSAASTKSFGRFFGAEFDTINKVARERVKDLQTQFLNNVRPAGCIRCWQEEDAGIKSKRQLDYKRHGDSFDQHDITKTEFKNINRQHQSRIHIRVSIHSN
jgi:hypothetical protein